MKLFLEILRSALVGAEVGVPEEVHLFGTRDGLRADDAETNVLTVGEIPNGFGDLRIATLEALIGKGGRGGGHVFCEVTEGAASQRPWVAFGGVEPRVSEGVSEERGIGCDGGIDGPFRDVAMHVVEAPRVGLLLGYLAVGSDAVIFGVFDEPGVVADLGRIVAEAVSGGSSSSASVFPFRRGGQAVEVTSLSGEPLTELGGRMVGHIHGRVVVILREATSTKHRVILRSRLRDGID